MAIHDSSGGEDSARFPFTSWCLLWGHTVRSKRHAAKHFAHCPKPHQLRCGCCGNDYNWAAYINHVNVRGVCKRHQLCWNAPFPRQPRYNVSCTRPFPQPSTGVAWSLAPLDEATAVAPPHFAMIAAASSDTPYQSPDYSSQQPIHASATNTSLASSTAYAETPASSTQQTASIIVPLRSVTPLSDVDEDLQRIIAEDYTDGLLHLPRCLQPLVNLHQVHFAHRRPCPPSPLPCSRCTLHSPPRHRLRWTLLRPFSHHFRLPRCPLLLLRPQHRRSLPTPVLLPTTVDSRWHSLHTPSGSRELYSPGQKPLPSRSLTRPAANSLLSVASG